MNPIMNNRNYLAHYNLSDLDRLFHTVFSDFNTFEPEMMFSSEFGGPSIEFSMTDDSVIATLPMPGCHPANMEIEVVGDWLTVKVKRERAALEKQDERFLRRERSCDDFEETIHVPAKVRGQETTAKYIDGVLTITMPKEVKKPGKHIVTVE